MMLHELVRELDQRDIHLYVQDGKLRCKAPPDAMTPEIQSALALRKMEIITQLTKGQREVPPNRIPPQCEAITPEMLPLVALTQAEIDRIVGQVPDGATNVQDIYLLAPLQEGILFHHLMATEGDAYLLPSLLGFDTRERLEGFLGALQSVIDRHDILRTAVLWEGVPEPVQVVWREAPLAVEEVALEAGEGDAAERLRARFDPRHFRIDVRQAPLLRGFVAHDAAQGRWLLLLLSHHLAIDHTAQEILIEEVQVHLVGQADQLAAPLPFRNFVAQARLGVSRDEHEAFFREMLGDVEEPTAPFGLLDVQGDGSGIEEASLELDLELARGLRTRARTLGVSAASLCHLAFAQVLGRLSGREDVVFGTVLFGRMQGGAGADRVLGMFINTLPVRITLDEEGVEAAVRGTHRCLAGLLRHEHASLALAQRCSAVPAPAPLFSALLNYRHSPEDDGLSEASLVWDGIEMLHSEERTNYPLTLSVDDLGEGFRLTAQVQRPIAPERLCGYMQTALVHLVAALETAPQTVVRTLEVLPDPERHQLLSEWNATEAEYPKDKCIHQLFEAQVERSPHATAVVYEDQSLRYRELNAKANQLAHHLRGLGVGPDTLVGICVERSLEMVVGLLGILKAGGAYLPLDPEYPKERLAYMLADARPSVLLTQARLREVLPEHPTIFCLDADWSSIARRSKKNPPHRTSPLNLAYVIYTSGSTGRPKGVAIPHGGLQNLVYWHHRAFRVGSADRATQLAGTAFDACAWEIWPCLTVGASLYLVTRDLLADSDVLWDWLARERITITFLPTPMAEVMLTQHFPDELCLRAMLTGGDKLHEHLRTSLPFGVINNYGPTENSVVSTSGAVTVEDTGKSPPIGRPITNVQTYILDARLASVPIGVPGELYVGGAGLARGYLNRPELTAERFVPNPFGAEPGERLYRTGDVARYRPDGNLEYLGRMDHQVKVRGFRIELGEIEAKLTEHPQVKEAVVLAREDTPGEKRLVGYVVGKDQEAVPAIDELRAHLRRVLPDYMVPGVFVFLEALPLTPNGKVDRKGLPGPDVSAQLAHRYVAPRTPTEWMLANQVAAVLGLDRVGMHDNFFFHLGGHSLLALQLMQRVRSTVDSTLPLTAIFQAPTVALLADWIAANIDKMRSPLVTMRSGERYRPLFCIHPGGHGVIKYQSLANAQDEGRAVYGIQSRALFDTALRSDSIDEMAKDYAELILDHCPAGPYNLLGWSMGGRTALAVAAHLERQGATVGFLGILDTKWSSNNETEHHATVLDHFRDFCEIHDPHLFDKLADAERQHMVGVSVGLSPEDRYIYAAMWGQDRGYWSDASVELMRFLYTDEQHDHAMMRAFKPTPILAPIHVWWARASLDEMGQPPLDWGSYTRGGVQWQVVNGNHESIVENPDVHVSVAIALRENRPQQVTRVASHKQSDALTPQERHAYGGKRL